MTPDQLPPAVARIIDRVVTACSPAAVVVFGSYAKGTHTANSDLDLLVVVETAEPLDIRSRRLRGLFARSPIRVDPIVYTPTEVEEELTRRYSFVASVIAVGLLVHGTIPAKSAADRGERTGGAVARGPADCGGDIAMPDPASCADREEARRDHPAAGGTGPAGAGTGGAGETDARQPAFESSVAGEG